MCVFRRVCGWIFCGDGSWVNQLDFTGRKVPMGQALMSSVTMAELEQGFADQWNPGVKHTMPSIN
jgi:hypothetical protein